MSDPYGGHTSGLDSPASDIFAITPHDTNDLAKYTRSFLISVAGDVAVITVEGTEIVIPSAIITVGIPFPLRVSRVKATGTTATGIYGLV